MFQAKIRMYKNINGKEEEIKKDFSNEKEFKEFLDKNPDFQQLDDWKSISWGDYLSDMRDVFEHAEKKGDTSFLSEMSGELKRLAAQSRKFFDDK